MASMLEGENEQSREGEFERWRQGECEMGDCDRGRLKEGE